jgi:methyl-accepting chemotaxis protein
MSESLPGDMGKLASILNQSFDQAESSVGMLISAMSALRSGMLLRDWDGYNRSGQFKGAWQSAVTDGEKALQTSENIFMAVINVMESAAKGDFTQRAEVSADGLFGRSVKAINETMITLETVITEINRVTEAQSKGDLTTTVMAHAEGQLNLMKESINHSISQMRQVVQQIYSSSHLVGDVASQVSRSAHDLSDRVQAQASALEETTSNIYAMSHAVKSNADNAQSASQLVSEMKSKVEAGVDVMRQTISAMSAISESSHRIADIVSLIDGIAFQTNLLALNAAVEAARAGEHGRGFAVVAGEVRALAQKSSDAAKDIRSLIQESVNRVDMGTALADQSGEMLQEIQQEITQLSGAIEQIATASAEQAQGINQVNLAIANIDKATQENAALVEETTTAAESMSSEANNLRHQVRVFRLSNHSEICALKN